MSHIEYCYHTSAPVVLASDGIHRMQSCCGAVYDRHFVNALGARLPGIAEQGRARSRRPRGLAVYDGALERPPPPPRGPAESFAGLRCRPDTLPLLPIPPARGARREAHSPNNSTYSV